MNRIFNTLMFQSMTCFALCLTNVILEMHGNTPLMSNDVERTLTLFGSFFMMQAIQFDEYRKEIEK